MVFMDDSEYLKVHWLKPPTTRVAKSFCCFAIVGFGLFTLWLASLPPSIALVKNLASHAKPSQESLKIENHLPPPDFLLPSNDYFDLESHRNTSHVIYDPFVRGVTRGQWPNERHSCIGPRGVPMDTDEHSKLKFYQPIEEYTHREPLPMIGSYEALGMDRSYCLDSFDRYSPYDFTKDKAVLKNLSWGLLQEQCLEKNKAHFPPQSIQLPPVKLQYPHEHENTTEKQGFKHSEKTNYHERTAVIIRKYDEQEFTPEITHFIRAVISETALYSGGKYTVYILMEVKDAERPIFFSESAYQKAITDYVPAEFQNMTVLWTDHLLRSWYPVAMEHESTEWNYHPPLQLFSIHAPQFDQIWNLELDARYTGHWFDLFENADAWARAQPRKLLWERAEQHYVPWYHGSWSNFSEIVAAANPDGGIWGPVRDETLPIVIEPLGPSPPTKTALEDNGVWGIGEQADFIGMSRIFDFTNRSFFGDLMKGFTEDSPTRVLKVQPVERVSKRLLQASHELSNAGFAWMTEGFYPTTALLHGLKAVHYPAPQFWGGMKSADRFDAASDIKKATGGFEDATDANQALNSHREGIYGQAYDVWMGGLAWSYYIPYFWRSEDGRDQYSMKLYKRWYAKDIGERLCLPGMIFHPIKRIDVSEWQDQPAN